MQNNIEILEKKEVAEQLSSRQRLDLLKNEVYLSIAKEFNVSYKTAERLSLLKTEAWLNSLAILKEELWNNQQIDLNDKKNLLSLENSRLQELYNAIRWAEKLTSFETIKDLEIIHIWNKNSLSKKLFPSLYNKAINPENWWDQIIWFCLWWLDSCSTTIKFLFDIWAWVTLSPHHTYIIISWKWQYRKVDRKTFILAFIVFISILWYLVYKINLIYRFI